MRTEPSYSQIIVDKVKRFQKNLLTHFMQLVSFYTP